jgi:hypothetical protein
MQLSPEKAAGYPDAKGPALVAAHFAQKVLA